MYCIICVRRRGSSRGGDMRISSVVCMCGGKGKDKCYRESLYFLKPCETRCVNTKIIGLADVQTTIPSSKLFTHTLSFSLSRSAPPSPEQEALRIYDLLLAVIFFFFVIVANELVYSYITREMKF